MSIVVVFLAFMSGGVGTDSNQALRATDGKLSLNLLRCSGNRAATF
jgi:hypothetical protein